MMNMRIWIVCGCLLFFFLYMGGSQAAVPAPIKDQGYGIVVSSHPLASAVGMEVLRNGATAVDAAVAVGFTLAVVHPPASNLGGGGFALLRPADGRTMVVDFREIAPSLATKGMYLDGNGEQIPEASTVGYKAAGVPGTVAGLCAILERYGTRKLDDLLAPAIELAERGVVVNALQEQDFFRYAPLFSRFESSRRYFLKPDGSPYEEGDTLVQKDLAKTLRLISEQGPDGFYKGKTAELVERDMALNGGMITRKDMAGYAVEWQEPLRGTYRDYEIRTVGLPSSGGILLLQLLNVMELSDVRAMGYGSSEHVHFMAKAIRRAFADRAAHLGVDAVADGIVPKLISKEYAKDIHADIMRNLRLAGGVTQGVDGGVGGGAMHYSVVDAWGNAVSVTHTLNNAFGSAAAVNGAGFLLNNEMDDFVTEPDAANIQGLTGGVANGIAPGKRPLSSITPAIVLKGGRNFLVLGSSGGSRIVSSVLQVISNVVDHGMDVSAAVMVPRFHLQGLGNDLRTEQFGLAKDVTAVLNSMGYGITVTKPIGRVSALLHDPETGAWYGVEDPRTVTSVNASSEQ